MYIYRHILSTVNIRNLHLLDLLKHAKEGRSDVQALKMIQVLL